jgi:hypothetical protein
MMLSAKGRSSMAVNIKEGPLIRLTSVPASVAWLPARRGKPLAGETVRLRAVSGLRARDGRIVRLECMSCGHGLAGVEVAIARAERRLQQVTPM